MGLNKSAIIGVLGVLGITGCCGPNLRASLAYDAANDIETKSQLAQADLKACKTEPTKCDQVDEDLKAIGETSAALKKAALSAGFEPGTTPATPTAASSGKSP